MAKKSTPWVKWFPEKFLHGISDLETANEIAVYTVVLNLIYDRQAPWPYSPKKLGARCKLRSSVVDDVVEGLIAEGKLILIDGCLTNEKAQEVIGDRQGVSEKATEAAHARWQEEKGKDKENKDGDDADASGAHGKKDAIEEGREKKKKEKKAPAKKPPPPAALDLDGGPDKSPARQAYELYNELADRIGATKASDLTDARRKSINARLNGRGIDIWKEAIEKVERSLFLCGEASAGRRGEVARPFKLSLDMMIRPENFQKIVEGFYGDDREPGEKQDLGGAEPSAWSAARWSRVMEIYRVSGSWPDDAGPEPGKPGCIAPQNGDDYVFQ